MSEVQDGFNIGLKGHLLIRDPETGQVILDRPTDPVKKKPIKNGRGSKA